MTTTATPTSETQASNGKPAQMIDVAKLPADQAVPKLIDCMFQIKPAQDRI